VFPSTGPIRRVRAQSLAGDPPPVNPSRVMRPHPPLRLLAAAPRSEHAARTGEVEHRPHGHTASGHDQGRQAPRGLSPRFAFVDVAASGRRCARMLLTSAPSPGSGNGQVRMTSAAASCPLATRVLSTEPRAARGLRAEGLARAADSRPVRSRSSASPRRVVGLPARVRLPLALPTLAKFLIVAERPRPRVRYSGLRRIECCKSTLPPPRIFRKVLTWLGWRQERHSLVQLPRAFLSPSSVSRTRRPSSR